METKSKRHHTHWHSSRNENIFCSNRLITENVPKHKALVSSCLSANEQQLSGWLNRVRLLIKPQTPSFENHLLFFCFFFSKKSPLLSFWLISIVEKDKTEGYFQTKHQTKSPFRIVWIVFCGKRRASPRQHCPWAVKRDRLLLSVNSILFNFRDAEKILTHSVGWVQKAGSYCSQCNIVIDRCVTYSTEER